jgi:hypothetical protein
MERKRISPRRRLTKLQAENADLIDPNLTIGKIAGYGPIQNVISYLDPKSKSKFGKSAKMFYELEQQSTKDKFRKYFNKTLEPFAKHLNPFY